MPIANCIVNENCITEVSNAKDVVVLWSQFSSKSSEHMTVNLISCAQQGGRQYAAVAILLLPSLWSEADRCLLQSGLAKALAHCFKVSLDDVIVMTRIIDSGHVVESGQVLDWN